MNSCASRSKNPTLAPLSEPAQNPTLAHSPAPWKLGLRQPTSYRFVYAADGAEVADCESFTNFAEANLANARLISAAPELLESVSDLLAYAQDVLENPEQLACFDRGVVQSHVAKALAALAKASPSSAS